MNDIQKHFLKVQRTARIYTLSNSSTMEVILLVLHGYGQLAYYFIQHFKCLVERYPLKIIAPEGLSRFYLDEQYRRVGASWMTREERHLEIEEQHAYLNQVIEYEINNQLTTRPKIHVLGFSQGSATAWRWVAATPYIVDRLILWAGMIPQEPLARLHPEQIIPVLGLSDPYFVGPRGEEYRRILADFGLSKQLVEFDGDHRIDQPTLNYLYDNYFRDYHYSNNT